MSTREPAPTRPKPAAMTTTMFGRYKLLGRIGEGGMAEVYRALMTGPEGFERELVVKRILPRLSETGDFKTMFIREAKISALLLHPNIVQIYEFGEADGAYFIAMENVQGVTLREALTTLRREQRAMPYLVAADIARQICIGLDYAHTLHGPDGAPLEIVHQDISPTNIMLAYTGTVKILDFGIARAASFAEEEAKKGLIKGKVSYLSPEQIHVRPFDARADVFALGVVFHEMLTGRRLFQAKNDISKMRQLLAQPILPPSSLNATIPRELDRIVMRSLALDANARYQTTSDMASDLERTLIAARYSSRELSKLLHGLFLPNEDPLVVVDTDDHKTVAMTGTGSGGSGPTGTSNSSGSRTSNSSGSRTPGSATRPTPTAYPTPAGPTSQHVRPTSPSASVTEPIPDVADVRPPDSSATRLERVVLEEQGRLARKRLRLRLRVLASSAPSAVVAVADVGGGVWAGRRYIPVLLAPARRRRPSRHCDHGDGADDCQYPQPQPKPLAGEAPLLLQHHAFEPGGAGIRRAHVGDVGDWLGDRRGKGGRAHVLRRRSGGRRIGGRRRARWRTRGCASPSCWSGASPSWSCRSRLDRNPPLPVPVIATVLWSSVSTTTTGSSSGETGRAAASTARGSSSGPRSACARGRWPCRRPTETAGWRRSPARASRSGRARAGWSRSSTTAAGSAGQELPHLADVVLGLEQPPPGQHLVEHHAQGEHVGAGVERPHVDLLGRQVADLPLDEALLGLLLGERGGARDPEVEDLHRAGVGQHDVGRRDVLVDDLQAPRRGHAACGRSRARCRSAGRCRRRPGRASRAARAAAW